MKTAAKVVGLLFASVFALASVESTAQGYPSKPIKLVVPYPPGGAADSVGRIIGQKLSERLNHPVTVENKAGGDSIIGTDYVAKAEPDGHTLLLGGSGGMVFNPGLYAHLPFDPIKDFVPITLLASDALVFAVNPSVPAGSIRELIALAKAKPGQLFYASGAPMLYVSTELFKKQAAIDIVHVPYKGTAQTITAAVSGEVPMVVASIASSLTQIRAGKLRALAITGLKRDPVLPDVPTVLESGLDFEGGIWTGLFAPAGTPRTIIDKIYGEMSVALKSDSLKERFASLGYKTSGMGIPPAEFDAFFKSNYVKWTKVIRELNIRAN